MKLVDIPVISQLASNVIRVLGCNPGVATLQGTNTYILGTGRKRLLVDTGDGFFTEYVSNLRSLLDRNEFIIEKILITHWHLDHTGGVDKVMEILREPVPVYKFPFPEIDSKYDFQFLPLKHDDVLSVEGVGDIKILHSPGHTDDSVMLHLVHQDALVCGDTILGQGTTIFTDLSAYMKSLELIKSLNPIAIYPGHGPEIKVGVEKVVAFYISHRLQREKMIFDVVSQLSRASLEEVVASLYPTKSAALATVNVRAHLQKLVKDGKIKLVQTPTGETHYSLN